MTLSRHFPTLIGLVEFVTPLFALLGFFALLGLKATVARDGTLQTPIAKTSRRGTFTTNPYYMIWVPRLGTYPPFLMLALNVGEVYGGIVLRLCSPSWTVSRRPSPTDWLVYHKG